MSKRLFVILFGIIAALCIVGFAARLLIGSAANALFGEQGGPLLNNYPTMEITYGHRAGTSVFAGRAHGNGKKTRTPLDIVSLYFVPHDASLTGLQTSGMSLRSVTRYDMIYARTPGYDGYFVLLSGEARDTGPPTLRLMGHGIDLVRDPEHSHDFENLGEKGRFYDSKNDDAPALTNLPPADSCSRTFLPLSGEKTGLVCASGRPVFEEDFYAQGEWLGTYAVWRTAAEKDDATIEKSSALLEDK